MRAARQVLRTQHRQHQRQIVCAHHVFAEHGAGHLGDGVLLQVFERPKTLHGALVTVVSKIRCVKRRDDRKQLGVFRFERRGQCGGLPVARAGDDLPLVDQVGIPAQRRGAPGVGLHPNARVRQRLGAHAHLHTRQQRGLAAVNAGHTEFSQPRAPGAVGQNHRFGDDQIQRRAALAGADQHLLGAHRFGARRFGAVAGFTHQPEVVVRSVESLGFAAHHFAFALQVFGESV